MAYVYDTITSILYLIFYADGTSMTCSDGMALAIACTEPHWQKSTFSLNKNHYFNNHARVYYVCVEQNEHQDQKSGKIRNEKTFEYDVM
jgi:hypothetical protein